MKEIIVSSPYIKVCLRLQKVSILPDLEPNLIVEILTKQSNGKLFCFDVTVSVSFHSLWG